MADGDGKAPLAKAAPKHWAHSYVERMTGEIDKPRASSGGGMSPYLGAIGTRFGQFATLGALAAGVGTADALFGDGVGDATTAALAFAGLAGSIALAESPVAANWAGMIGGGALFGLVRSRARKFVGSGPDMVRPSTPGGGGTSVHGDGSSATDRIAAVAEKLG